ncbi:Uncharacterised protein [Mycobacterium tuberculosis]|uniref:Secreted protein n=1 Tax=Mycobacterium tuberculosis TaxID=1773 RepID=A0A0T9FJL6_MYCTX|nr:Uncharacterised protein [Mycobacterium tuberculosis]CKU42377.1 Uncharacterised protein [Mycobacterium tuberculosis]CNL71945.1 Uncharacterised protein [Mycobacterium tuberculosis]CNM62483.1 Uncharacterised protein [Mycobacterium tuberculosis]CNM63751.1 Uncharacterised protein [Mycobacterium tuberculosis]
MVASATRAGCAIVAAPAAIAAPRASANVGSSGVCTRIVDAARSWSARTVVCSADLPTRKTSPGARAWSPSRAIRVSTVDVASAPATGATATIVGGASGSPTTDKVAVSSPTNSTAEPACAAPTSAVAACASDITATSWTPESCSACCSSSALA